MWVSDELAENWLCSSLGVNFAVGAPCHVIRCVVRDKAKGWGWVPLEMSEGHVVGGNSHLCFFPTLPSHSAAPGSF